MDIITQAKINLFAILRNLEDLCRLDKTASDIIKDVQLSVQFNVPDVGSATFDFDHGKCVFHEGKSKAALKLYFTSPVHFNNMIQPPVNEKTGKPKMVVPIFYNVFKVGFLLKQFTALADRLTYFLMPPDPKLLEDRTFFEINTELTLYTALFALCQVGNSDRIGRLCARRINDGVIAVGVADGPQLKLVVKDHHMTGYKERTDEWHAQMLFSDMDFAHDLLNGKASSFGGMGSGQFAVRGCLDMLEQIAKLLNLVSAYLK